MSAQRKLRLQTMTGEDRQFDALLRRAAQHIQKVPVDMQTQRNISRGSQHGRERSLRFSAHAAKG